jgi:hypothetical protein
MPDIMPGILFGILTSAQRNFAEPDVLPADEGNHVADGAEVAVGVDGRLDLLLDVRDNLVPGPATWA